jgi:hypothetical protein
VHSSARPRQRDGVSCGPAVAVVARALLAGHEVPVGCWFDAEQTRLHAVSNMAWPRALGTTPAGMVAALAAPSGEVAALAAPSGEVAAIQAGYRWRPCRGLWGRRDGMVDVLDALADGKPVAMLIGNVLPRHWVLLLDREMRCYEPSSGEIRTVPMADVRAARLTGLGFPRPWAFVLPR